MADDFVYDPRRPRRTDERAIWALVSSIAGFVICPGVLHVVGWVLADQSMRTIEASRFRLNGWRLARAAKILGVIGVVLFVLFVLLSVWFFATFGFQPR